MTVKLTELLGAMESYKKLDKEKVPLKTAYKLAKLHNAIETEVKLYEEMVRNALIKYSKRDENGEPIVQKVEEGEKIEIDPEQQQACIDEITDLNNSSVEIADCNLSISDFGDLTISLDEIRGLIPFIKED